MHSPAQTECLSTLEGRARASGVESTRIRGKETTALMPRKNLLSLFAEFSRFGGDVAVVQRRGYRRGKLTYTGLYANALLWSRALAGRGGSPGDRVLLWGPNSAEWVACYWGILFPGALVVRMDAAASPASLTARSPQSRDASPPTPTTTPPPNRIAH